VEALKKELLARNAELRESERAGERAREQQAGAHGAREAAELEVERLAQELRVALEERRREEAERMRAERELARERRVRGEAGDAAAVARALRAEVEALEKENMRLTYQSIEAIWMGAGRAPAPAPAPGGGPAAPPRAPPRAPGESGASATAPPPPLRTPTAPSLPRAGSADGGGGIPEELPEAYPPPARARARTRACAGPASASAARAGM
jgi:hypothetical protein